MFNYFDEPKKKHTICRVQNEMSNRKYQAQSN